MAEVNNNELDPSKERSQLKGTDSGGYQVGPRSEDKQTTTTTPPIYEPQKPAESYKSPSESISSPRGPLEEAGRGASVPVERMYPGGPMGPYYPAEPRDPEDPRYPGGPSLPPVVVDPPTEETEDKKEPEGPSTEDSLDVRKKLEALLQDPTSHLTDSNLLQTYQDIDIYKRDADGKIMRDSNGEPLLDESQFMDSSKNQLSQLGKLDASLTAEVSPLTGAPDVQYSGYDATTSAPLEAQTVAQAVAESYTASLIDPSNLTKAVDEIEKLDPMKAASMADELNGLLEGMEEGNIPLWARPAVAKVEQQLAGRGISASSIGRDSLFNAIIQAAMPIAQQDATFKQDTYKTTYQAKVQAVLSDVNMEFAAKQFNAQSKNQASQFNAQMKTQVSLQNAARQDAMVQFNAQMQQSNQQFNASQLNTAGQFNAQMQTQVDLQNAARQDAMLQFSTQMQVNSEQFNASQVNAMVQMEAQLQNQRDQFNANMSTQIEQSNVQWRRQTNQANTAGVNAVNQANVQNAFNLSNQALTFLWQEMRDNAQWDFQASESEKDRKAQIEAAILANETAMGGEIGKTIENLLNGSKLLGNFLDSWRD